MTTRNIRSTFVSRFIISQELALLGISLHKKTVQRILIENGIVPPRTKFPPPTWRNLLKPYDSGWALDFTTWFDKDGAQLFILVIIDLCTRELVSINATTTPDRHWITQQICNAAIDGFTLPQTLRTDNDGIFGKWLKLEFKEIFGIDVELIPRGAESGETWSLSKRDTGLFCIRNNLLARNGGPSFLSDNGTFFDSCSQGETWSIRTL